MGFFLFFFLANIDKTWEWIPCFVLSSHVQSFCHATQLCVQNWGRCRHSDEPVWCKGAEVYKVQVTGHFVSYYSLLIHYRRSVCISELRSQGVTSMVEHLLMGISVVGSIPHGGPIELFLIPASAPQLVHYPGMVHINDPLLLTENFCPVTGVCYNSLLWMCRLNTLTWPNWKQ